MHLEPHDVKRFYNIWFPLLFYVNQQRQLVSSFPDKWGDNSVNTNDAAILRDALWGDDLLREGFIKGNPANLSSEDIALVESWQYRVSGKFFIFRYLKKHTIFLSSDSPARAYGVLGLVSPFEDMFYMTLPIYADAVLIPFEGRITYDSLMSTYSLSFGPGYRSSFADSYRSVQEREGIITTLTPDPEANCPENIKMAIQARNKKLLRVFQKELGKSGLSRQKMEEHTGNIAAFGDDFLLAQDSPHGLIETSLNDVRNFVSAKGKKSNLVSFKRFIRFLRDTWRMDYGEAEDILDFLKQRE
jgi:hypothetical protein